MDTVISGRIRLARNISAPFFLKGETADNLTKKVFDLLKKIDKFTCKKISDLSSGESVAMMERHLISRDLIKNPYGAVMLNEDESISIMVNEEDHLREQCILPGLALEDAYRRINLIDNELSALKFAFSPQKGYLTSCITNLGTGMRASVMMFLPALTLTKTIEECLASVSRLGIAVRGVYGEGSDSGGFIYQISNQRTLGVTENDILSSVNSVAVHITNAELKAREVLMRMSGAEIKDKILRSYGTLRNCYMLTHGELMHLIAFVKLGLHYGMFSAVESGKLDALVTQTGPANLVVRGEVQPQERDILRAKLVTEFFASLRLRG